MRPAHVSRQPSEAHHVRARLAGIAEQHRRFIGARRVADPFDVAGGFEIHRAAIDVRRIARCHYEYHSDQCEENPARHHIHFASHHQCPRVKAFMHSTRFNCHAAVNRAERFELPLFLARRYHRRKTGYPPPR